MVNKDFKDTYPTEFGCHNYCHGGRKKCPVPEACIIPEEEVDRRTRQVFIIIVACIFVASLLAFV
jgi:hypothetical protein